MAKKVRGKGAYFSYNLRLIIYIVLFLILFVFACIYCIKSLDFATEEYLNYKENSNIDYKVYLKENDFYTEKFLGMDRTYVSSLIDKIKIDFNYGFNVDKNININFNYYVTAKVLIQDDSGGSTFYEREYYLTSIKSNSLVNSSLYNVSESVDIDYHYYDNLVNSFSEKYKVSTKNSLIIYLKVSKKDNNNIGINDSNIMMLTIPLSNSTVNITTSYTPNNNNSKLLSSTDLSIGNIFCFIFSMFLAILGSICFIRFIRLIIIGMGKKSKYDRLVGRILKEYDTVIVNSNLEPDLFNNKINVIKIDEFKELLDVRDNLKLPVMYYVVSEHVKCYFYIKNGKDLYVYIIKAVDLESDEKKK